MVEIAIIYKQGLSNMNEILLKSSNQYVNSEYVYRVAKRQGIES